MLFLPPQLFLGSFNARNRHPVSDRAPGFLCRSREQPLVAGLDAHAEAVTAFFRIGHPESVGWSISSRNQKSCTSIVRTNYAGETGRLRRACDSLVSHKEIFNYFENLVINRVGYFCTKPYFVVSIDNDSQKTQFRIRLKARRLRQQGGCAVVALTHGRVRGMMCRARSSGCEVAVYQTVSSESTHMEDKC